MSRLAFINEDLRRDWPWLSPVLLAGLALRLWGIGFGLPGLYHTDENLIVRQALAFGAGILRPYSYVYSPFLPYCLTFLYGLYFLVGLLTGRFHSPSDLAILYFNDPTPFYLLARLTSAVFGLAAVVITYILATRMYGRVAGVSAVFVALSPALVLHSHYGMSDVPVACLILVALYALWCFIEEPTTRRLFIAGIVVGLAIVMKYSAWVLIFPLIVTVIVVARRERWPGRRILGYLALGGFVAIGTFLVISPYTALDFRNFWADVVIFQLGTQLRQGESFIGLWTYYLSAFAVEGLSFPLLVAALIGSAYAIYLRRPADILLVSFLVPYLAMLLFQGRQQFNWIVPVIPVLCILASLTLDAIWRAMSAAWMRWRPAALVVLAIMIGPMAHRAYERSQWLSWPDTRNIAREWIEAHIPAGARILSDPMWTVPQLRQNRESLIRYLGERANAKDIENRPESTRTAYSQYVHYQLAALESYSGPTYDIVYIQHEWWKSDEGAPDIQVYPVWGLFEGRVFSLDELRAQGFQYVVVSSLKYLQYLREEGKEKWPSYYALYSSLEEQCRLVQVFAPDTGIAGPIVKLYDLHGQP